MGESPLFVRGSAFEGMPISVGFALPVFVGNQVAAVLEFFFVQRFSIDIWPEMTEAVIEQISRLYERKLAEESANESRDRFDAAVNGAAVGLWDYNYKNGIFYLSPRCRDILHIEQGSQPPTWKAFGARIHPEDVRRTASAMRAHMIKRTPYDVEYRYRTSEGRYIWLHSRAQGVWDGTGTIIRTAGTIEDISAEKEGENVQREVLACIAGSDDTSTKVTKALNRVCTYLNLETAIVSHVADDQYEVRYRSSLGAGPALNTSIPLSETICSDIYSADTLQIFPALENSPVATHPARALHGIEAYIGITVFVKGVRFGTLSFYGPKPRESFSEMEIAMVRLLGRWIGEEIGRASDVAELIENDVRISAKLASVADALLTVDHNGMIEDANPAAARLFSWSTDEMRKMPLATLLPTAKTFSHPDGRLIPVQLRQDVAIRKDGQRLAVLLNVSEIHLGNRKIYTVAMSDLTEVKQAEVAKGAFISTVSHELRTPLTSIRGAIDLIVSQITGPLAPETAALAEVAQRNCDRLLRLVNDILSIEKLESGRFEMTLQPLDVRPILTEAAHANALYAAKFDSGFELSIADDLPMVIADNERLMQVMANLLSNAAKFTRPGTKIYVSAQRSGKYVRISVRDQGAGIPDRIRHRIFEKFMQGEAVNTRGCEGSGLGLSIARQLVELMNGEIGFETEKDAGTTFSVNLPIADLSHTVEEVKAI